MRSVVVLVALTAVVGCHKYSDRLADAGFEDSEGGEGEGEGASAPCPGAALYVQASLANDSTGAQLVVESQNEPVVLFGPKNGTAFDTLKGYFEVTGYPANAKVTAQVVSNPCATTGCPTSVGFRFFGTQNLTNNADGACGSTTVTADGAGAIDVRITGGGTGGGSGGGSGLGPEGPDTGLLLTPQ